MIAELYRAACEDKTSDIYYHLPQLKAYASECPHVTEFGTRRGNSTLAFLSANPDKLISYDLGKWKDIETLEYWAKNSNINYTFIQANVLEIDIETTDLLFIDTFHTYSQLKAELKRHASKASKYIALHDTTTFGEVGEPSYEAVSTHSMNCGRGIWKAVEEFMTANPEWSIAYKTEENNGLTILKK